MAENPVHGQAEFMREVDLKKRFSPKENDGLWFSEHYRMSQKASNANIATLGVTGSGKSHGLGFRNVLECSGSMVITDLSGEYFQHTSGHLAEKNITIHIFNPTDVEHSLRFNPLLRLTTHQEKKFLAQSVSMRMNSDSEPIWATLAGELIFLTIHALSEYAALDSDLTEPKNWRYNTMGNVLWIISHILNHQKPVEQFFIEALADAPYSLSKFMSFLGKDDKIISGTITTAEAALDLFTDPAVRQLTASDTICLDPAVMRKRKVVTYLIIPEHLTGYYGLLLNLFYTCLNDQLMRSPLCTDDDLPINLLLDEFPAMGKIHNIANIATTMRKRNVSLHMIFQSWSQLESIYGKDDATTILEGGVSTKIFLPGLGLRTAKWLEESLGYTTVYDSKYGGVSQHTVKESLMSADEVRMLDDEHAIVITGNKKPMKIHISHAYKTNLATLLQKPPAALPFQPLAHEYLLPLDHTPSLHGLGKIISQAQESFEEEFASAGKTAAQSSFA